MKRRALLTKIFAGALTLATVTLAQEQPAPKHERTPLTDEQRAQMEQRLDNAWKNLAVREKMQVMRFHQAMKEMPPEERQFIHDRLERFLNMSAEEREKIKQNHERWKQMSPEDKQQARLKFQQRRKEFEEKWRSEHPGQEPPPFPFRGEKKPGDQ